MLRHVIISHQGKVEYLFGPQISEIEGLSSDKWEWKNIIRKVVTSRNPFVMRRHVNGMNAPSSIITVWDPSEIVFSNYHENKIFKIIEDIPKMLSTKLSDITKIDGIELERYIGFYGFLGFELSRCLEQYDNRADHGLLPDLYFIFPTKYLIDDGERQIYIELEGDIKPYQNEIATMDRLDNFQFQMPITHYLQSLEAILNHIRNGEIYQTNFTHKFMFPTEKSPIDSYLELIEKNTTEHHAFISNDEFSIISISPELFIHAFDGMITTKPIKGTIKRGQTAQEDERNKQLLLNSEKDKAELTMIVDLLRNDLGRTVKAGSVQVESHAKLETFSNVHHLVSTIKGKIVPDIQSSWKLLLRAFPGGSISGVPKLRALELLERYETTPRSVYTGSIGCLTSSGDMEFNIAIRTLTQIKDQVFCNAGGGIVVDSDPWSEFIETIHKAKHLISYFGYDLMEEIVWLNGEFIARHNINTDFKSSSGFFETIKVENSTIKGFDRHWSRILLGFEYYNIQDVRIHNQVHSISDFKTYLKSELQKFAMLNLHPISRMKASFIIQDTSLDILVEMFEYITPKDPIKLLLAFDEFDPVEEVLSGIKPLNYSTYRDQTRIANEMGYWDMLLHRNGQILEAGKASILYCINDEWFFTKGAVLNGTIRNSLMSSGLSERILTLEELSSITQLFVCNAMVEILPVGTISSNSDNIWISNPNYDMIAKYRQLL